MGITDAGIWFQAADSINERLRKKTIYENLQNSFNIKKAALYWKYFNFKDHCLLYRQNNKYCGKIIPQGDTYA